MNKRGITVKIWLSIGVFVLGFVLSTCMVQVAGLSAEKTARVSAQSLFPAAQQAQDAQFAFQTMVKGFGDAVIMQNRDAIQTGTDSGRQIVNALRKISKTDGLDAERKSKAAKLADAVALFTTDAGSIYPAVIAAGMSMPDGLQQKMQTLAGRTNDLRSDLDNLTKGLSKALQDQLNETEHKSRTQRWISLGVFFATLVIAGAIVRFTIRHSIAHPIKRVIDGVQEAADSTASASARMAESGETLTSGAQQQMAYIEETSASLEEINAISRENVNRAQHADELMQSAAQTAAKASQSMKDLTTSMHAISSSSQQVSEVLKSIDEIAFHTNILALNAAVEAARAGEAGAGFSVVADEVRSLARRAAEAAGRSGEIVEKTLKDVKSGVTLLSAAHKAFDEVSSSIGEGSTVASQIASGSQEQARGIAHVAQAIARIEKVTQKNVENADQTVQAAATMASQIDATRRHIDELITVVGIQD